MKYRMRSSGGGVWAYFPSREDPILWSREAQLANGAVTIDVSRVLGELRSQVASSSVMLYPSSSVLLKSTR